MSDQESEFKKVDSDWKDRLEADREKLQEKIESQEAPTAPIPPATFMTILSSFATQTMIALGEVEVPGAEGRAVDLDAARLAIDLLGVLKEKTAGNLNDIEQRSLDDVLQNLRLRFVQKSSEAETSA
jgi:hypothetical protein